MSPSTRTRKYAPAPTPAAAEACGRVPLEAVITTAELERRPARASDFESESRSLAGLLRALREGDKNVLQQLADTALHLCRAHSAGVSVEEEQQGHRVFRWHGAAGQWAPFRGETTPRDSSPCGAVLDRNTPLLMEYPARHFTLPDVDALSVTETLLVPFAVDGVTVGTVWLGSHDESRRFDREDLRLLTSLSECASVAYQVLERNSQMRQALVEHAMRDADRRKDEFLAILSHELRNPLAPITTGLELLRRPGNKPELIGSIHLMMGRQISHLTRLVNDLLDLSRITRGKIELQRATLDLRVVIAAAIDLVRPLVDQRGHELVVEQPAHSPCVDGDLERLTQVVSNVLGNAAKYTDPGGRIHLRVSREGGHALMRVSDSGLGIPAGQLEQVFAMFAQVPEHRARVGGGGLGIGLALARRLIELHGGTIVAASEGLGHGSEFLMRLPLAAAEEPAARVA